MARRLTCLYSTHIVVKARDKGIYDFRLELHPARSEARYVDDDPYDAILKYRTIDARKADGALSTLSLVSFEGWVLMSQHYLGWLGPQVGAQCRQCRRPAEHNGGKYCVEEKTSMTSSGSAPLLRWFR